MRRARGFSIVEYMVSVAVGMVLLIAIVGSLVTSRLTQRTTDSVSRLDDSARLAFARLTRDVQNAGFRGCLGDRPALRAVPTALTRTTLNAPLPYVDDFATGIQGFATVGGVHSPALPAAVSGLAPAPDAGQDVLTVRTTIGPALPLIDQMSSGNSQIPMADVSFLPRNQRAIIANCVQAVTMAISDPSVPAAVKHTPPENATNDLGWAFGPDAVVAPLATVTWYVAPTPAVAGQSPGLSLYRVQQNAAPEEVIDGVEGFRVLYGENLSGELPNGTTVAERYVTAAGVANWSNVIAVRIELLLRSVDAGAGVPAQTYAFAGQSRTATDLRLRGTFTTNITLRNRTN